MERTEAHMYCVNDKNEALFEKEIPVTEYFRQFDWPDLEACGLKFTVAFWDSLYSKHAGLLRGFKTFADFRANTCFDEWVKEYRLDREGNILSAERDGGYKVVYLDYLDMPHR